MSILSGLFRNRDSKQIQYNEEDYRDDVYNAKITEIVNKANYASITDYLVYVQLDNFRVNIFKGGKNKWFLQKSYLCTIGKPSTPTPTGEFKVGVKGLFFGVNRGYKCWYYTSYKGNYLFHSIIYNLNGSVRDGRLGMKLSDGCIRLAKVNAKWLLDNVPTNSKVVIV